MSPCRPFASRLGRLAAGLAAVLAWAQALAAADARLAGATRDERADAHLRRVLERIAQRRLGEALEEADRLVARHPNFRLAHLVRGDLLRARAGPIAGLGSTGHAARERLDELRAEALARLHSYDARSANGYVPRALLQLEPGQKHALLVDASRSRVYVFENANGTPRLVDDFYATLGKAGVDKQREGDRRTPLGVYRVVSRIPGAKLPDLYGWGAFPIDYPNEWDRLAGRTGYGIWLHGVPSDTYARAPLASDGCIALANPDIAELAERVQVGATPVIIAERLEWVAGEAWRAERDAFLRQLERWLADWVSLDTGRYLGHYARAFRSDGMDLGAWQAHKRRVNAAKSWIRVAATEMSVFRSSAKGSPIVVTFTQDYRSSNLSQRTRKRQYWIEEEGRWKIAYEAPVGRPVVALPESYRSAAR
jgi:murein L,D-transpeptidase YafK